MIFAPLLAMAVVSGPVAAQSQNASPASGTGDNDAGEAWKKIEQQLKERAEQRRAALEASKTAGGNDKTKTPAAQPEKITDPSGSGAAGKPSTAWADIEKRIKERRSGSPTPPSKPLAAKPAAKPPSVKEIVGTFGQQVMVQKISDDAASKFGLRYVDLRSGMIPLTGNNPFASSLFAGQGFATGELKVDGDKASSLSFVHVSNATLSLMASKSELNATIERQSVSEAKIQTAMPDDGQLTFTVTNMRSQRNSLFPVTGYGLYGGLGFGLENGTTDTVVLGARGSFFADRLSIESYVAQSRFWAERANSAIASSLSLQGGMDDAPKSGFGQMHKFQARLYDAASTKLTVSGSALITDRDFRSSSYEASPDTRDFSLAARGNWEWLKFDVTQRWRYDGSYNTDSANLNAGASANFDNFRFGVRHNQQRYASSYAYLTYDYLPTTPGNDPTYDWLPVFQKVSNASVIVTDSANFSWSDSEQLWGLQFSGRQSKSAYSYGESATTHSLSRTLSLSGSREFGSFGLQLSGQHSLQRRQSTYLDQTLRNEATLTFALALDDNKPEYGSHAIGRPSAGQAAGFSFLGPGGMPYVVGAPGAIGAPRVGGSDTGGSNAAKPGAQDTRFEWLSALAPSSIRASLVGGKTDYRNTAGGGGYYSYGYGSAPAAGPYWAFEFGANWQGLAGQTDLSIRYTANAGDRNATIAPSVGYDVMLTQNLSFGSWTASANANFSLADYGPGSVMKRQTNASGYLTLGYRTPLITVDGRLYGNWASTAYSDPGYAYAPSAFLTAELSGEFVLDEWMPVRQGKDEAPPYLRLRGFAAYQYPANYVGLAPVNYGVLLVAGTHW